MLKENRLLSRIAKAMGKKEEIEMKEEKPAETLTVTVDATAVKAELAQLQAEFESNISELKGQLEAAMASVEELKSALDAEKAAKEELIAKAKDAKLAARKERVVAAVGTDKADGVMAAVESLDDAAFEAIVSAMQGSVDAEAKSSMFKEVGVTAEVDASKVAEESQEMKLLKAKYKKQD